MLMRNADYQVDNALENALENRRLAGEPLVDYEPREMLLGQFALFLLFVIAILLRAMA